MPKQKPQSVPRHWTSIELTTQVTGPGGPFAYNTSEDEPPILWLITEDLISDKGERTRVGYHNIPPEHLDDDRSKWHPFWVADDDGELYYGGWMSAVEFGPQDFAMADAGCVCLWWWNGKKNDWEIL